MLNERLTVPTSRWISVAFLQGDNADKALRMIHSDGEVAAMAHLRSLDHGDETTDAALTNGYVYDRIPAGTNGRAFEDVGSPYALTYSTQHRYVSVLRRYPCASQSASDWALNVPLPQKAQPRHGVADIWNAASRPTTSARHTVAL